MKLSKQIFSIEKIPDKRQYNRWPANIVYHKEAAMDVFWWSWQRLIYIIIRQRSELVSDSVSIKLKNYKWYHLEIFTHYSRNFWECTEIFWWPFIESQGQHKFNGDCGVLFPKNLALYHRLQSGAVSFTGSQTGQHIGSCWPKPINQSQYKNHFFFKNCTFACLIVDSYSV